MKKFFTLIAAVALAASVNAQTFKSFEKTTVFITNQENIKAGIAEGWIAEGSGQSATTKTGSINPETGEEESYKQPGITLKKGNDLKALTVYVKGLTGLTAYGATTSSSDTRDLYVVATPKDGSAAVEVSASSEPSVTAVASLVLDAAKEYTVVLTGVKEGDKESGSDVALHGIKFVPGTSTGISSVNAAAAKKDGKTYNMAGQEVSSSAKGLIIKNGKKYVK
nr:hypothetical protein [Prevotella sp.]